MIKVVFFDIDGTIISHNTESIEDSTREAIALLKEKGIHVCVVTGRHMREMDEFPVFNIDFDGYIMQNGQITYDRDKKFVAGFPIDEACLERFLKIFDEKKIPLMFIDEDDRYMSFVNDYVCQAQADVHTSVPPVSEYRGKPIYQICAYVDNDEAEVLKREFADCKENRWHKYSIEFVDGAGGKMAGIDKYIAGLGITRQEIMAIGDGENDMDMIMHAGIGVAMGNADEHVKAVADYVTADVDHGGVMQALKHFGVI